MPGCLDILKKLQKVDILLSAQIAMEDTASQAVFEQKIQLSQGVKSDDSMMPDYSWRSVFQYNKEPGPIKLYDEGNFYGGILFDVRQDIYILDSSDYKTMMLKKRYGPDILGLGTEAKNKYIASLRPVFLRRIHEYLL